MTKSRRIISLTTDFGHKDGYVGIVKGVILSIAPAAIIVDISHGIEPFDIASASWVIANSSCYFPPGSVHVAVVDPQVGSQQRKILIEGLWGTFIGPDNGLFSRLLERDHTCRAYELKPGAHWLSPVSNTFHARDIYAPVAAHLLNGTKLKSLAQAIPLESLSLLPMSLAVESQGISHGEVVYIDCYGNLITNIPSSTVSDESRCYLADKLIGSVSSAYADSTQSSLAVIPGSHGFLEIGAHRARANELCQASIGQKVRMEVVK